MPRKAKQNGSRGNVARSTPIWCAYDKIVPLAQLKENPRNPNQHPPEQIKLLAHIIAVQGWRNPIVVSNRSGMITKGHARLYAARAIKAKDAPVDYQDYGSESEELADMIADNRIAELAEADRSMLRELFESMDTGAFDMDLTGFDQVALEELMTATAPESDVDAEPQIDKAEELRKKWGVERGQIWELGEHRLMCGDSTTPGALLNGDLPDCIFTSPPYAVGVDYGPNYDDTIENLRGLIASISKIWFALLPAGGFAVVNFGDIASGSNVTEEKEPCEYPVALEYWPKFREAGFLLWSRRIWCKPNPRVNSLQCISSNRAATDWEHIWTWKKPGTAIVSRTEEPHRSCIGWFDTTCNEGVEVGKETHGAGMATSAANRMISIHSRPKATVFEPFNGTGTTLIACEQLNRKCRAMEIDPGYVAVSIQRWVDATGKTPKLLNV